MTRPFTTALFFACLTVAVCIAPPKACAGINEWTYLGLAPEEISSYAVHPTDPSIGYVSALDVYWDSTSEGGLFKTTDGGRTWDTLGFRHSHVREVSIDEQNPQTVWIANDTAGVWRSGDGGQTWENRSTGIHRGGTDEFGPGSLAVCPYDSRYLLCGDRSVVGQGRGYFTTDTGADWNVIPQIFSEWTNLVTYDRAAPGVAYAVAMSGASVWMSADTGRNFSQMTASQSIEAYDLKTAPNRAGMVWFVTREHRVRVSSDSGRTWTPTLQQFDGTDTVVTSLEIVGRGDTMFVATNRGPYFSRDGGASLVGIGAGIPAGNRARIMKVVRTNPLEVWMFRDSHGIWTYTIDSTESSRPQREHPRSELAVTAFPNPFNPILHIRYVLPTAGAVTLKIYDVLGREAATLLDKRVNAGSYSAEWNAENFPSGMYFAVLQAGSQRLIQKMLLLK